MRADAGRPRLRAEQPLQAASVQVAKPPIIVVPGDEGDFGDGRKLLGKLADHALDARRRTGRQRVVDIDEDERALIHPIQCSKRSPPCEEANCQLARAVVRPSL